MLLKKTFLLIFAIYCVYCKIDQNQSKSTKIRLKLTKIDKNWQKSIENRLKSIFVNFDLTKINQNCQKLIFVDFDQFFHHNFHKYFNLQSKFHDSHISLSIYNQCMDYLTKKLINLRRFMIKNFCEFNIKFVEKLVKINQNWQKSAKINQNWQKSAKIDQNWQKSTKIDKNQFFQRTIDIIDCKNQ